MFKMKKKALAGALAFVLTAAGLTACGGTSSSESSSKSADEVSVTSESTQSSASTASSSDQEQKTVRIQVSKGTVCGVAMQVAAENGYFEEEFDKIGQKVEITVEASSETYDLLAANQIDAAFGLASNFIVPISNGLDVAFTVGVHKGCTKFYSLADSGITSLEDLKGKTVGVPTLVDSSTLSIKRKLADMGFDLSSSNPDVTFVAYSMTDLPAALANGAVDAIGVHEPVGNSVEENYDVNILLDTGMDEKFKDEYCCTSLVTQKMLEENPEGVAAFTKAVERGAAFVKANPKEAAEIQIEGGYVSGDAETNAEILSGLDFTPSVSAARQTFSNAFSDLQKTGDIDASLDEAEFTKKAFPVVDGVPESCTYDTETGEFTFTE